MSETFVKSFTHLKDRPHADRALPFLQRVASLVKPIMRKHGWVLPVLAEFFPDSRNLVGLNVNGGQKILLRLRPPWSPDTFYDEDQVVRVMLHELTHNVHGPHDQKFYKLLAELEDEYDALRRSGYAGEGFYSKGQRVGAGVSHDLPTHLARAKALEAAEKRRKISVIMSGGGRLGGRVGAMQGLSPRELAAQAAERRRRDETACRSGVDAQKEADKAAKESVEDKVIIDLTSDDDVDLTPSVSGPSAPPSRRISPTEVRKSKPKPQSLLPSSARVDRPDPAQDPGRSRMGTTQPLIKHSRPEWTCAVCTLINEPLALQCAACLSERPQEASTGWTCLTCGETGMPHQFWTCTFCGSVKTSSVIG